VWATLPTTAMSDGDRQRAVAALEARRVRWLQPKPGKLRRILRLAFWFLP
jgi:hypothetical protein